MKLYYVYILASIQRVLYVGFTGTFEQRIAEHRAHKYPQSFTAQYNVTRLVYFEEYTRVEDALAREKQLKAWRREKKVWLIERFNPGWEDLAAAPPDAQKAELERRWQAFQRNPDEGEPWQSVKRSLLDG